MNLRSFVDLMIYMYILISIRKVETNKKAHQTPDFLEASHPGENPGYPSEHPA